MSKRKRVFEGWGNLKDCGWESVLNPFAGLKAVTSCIKNKKMFDDDRLVRVTFEYLPKGKGKRSIK